MNDINYITYNFTSSNYTINPSKVMSVANSYSFKYCAHNKTSLLIHCILITSK